MSEEAGCTCTVVYSGTRTTWEPGAVKLATSGAVRLSEPSPTDSSRANSQRPAPGGASSSGPALPASGRAPSARHLHDEDELSGGEPRQSPTASVVAPAVAVR